MAIFGFKVLKLVRFGEIHALVSPVFSSTFWASSTLPCESVEARCTIVLTKEHEAPTEGCSCGIYAFSRFEYAQSAMDIDCVVALIQGWGKTFIMDRGWIFQEARLVSVVSIPHFVSSRDINRMFHLPNISVLQARDMAEMELTI